MQGNQKTKHFTLSVTRSRVTQKWVEMTSAGSRDFLLGGIYVKKKQISETIAVTTDFLKY